jgi:hypothetical protein
MPEHGWGMCLQGYAVRAGMLSARGKIALFMDADGATKVSDIEKLEASLQIIATGDEYIPPKVNENVTRLIISRG